MELTVNDRIRLQPLLVRGLLATLMLLAFAAAAEAGKASNPFHTYSYLGSRIVDVDQLQQPDGTAAYTFAYKDTGIEVKGQGNSPLEAYTNYTAVLTKYGMEGDTKTAPMTLRVTSVRTEANDNGGTNYVFRVKNRTDDFVATDFVVPAAAQVKKGATITVHAIYAQASSYFILDLK